MATTSKGICRNRFECDKADNEEIIVIEAGKPFVCPNCGKPLEPSEGGEDPPIDWKKIITIIIIIAILGGLGFGAYKLFSGSGESPLPSVTISPENPTIMVGENVKLSAKTDPESACKNIKWKWASNDDNIATVSSKGLVTGAGEGSVTVTAVDEKNEKFSASVTVIVQSAETIPPPPGDIESVSLNHTTLNLKENGTATLTASVLPEKATDKSVAWSSSDKAIAKVDNNGEVTGIKAGTATITTKAVADNSKFAKCVVTVEKEGETTKTYSFGKYEGKLVNGRPDGQGTMYYTCRVQIAKHGRNTQYAEKGDVLVGTWGNGDIVNGNLYDSSNNQKAAILAGKRPNPYELSNDKCE